MANIFSPNEVRTFLETNGYPSQYNDGMRAYLRAFFNLPEASLADLYVRYILEEGTTLVPVGGGGGLGEGLLLESGDFLLLESGDNILLEA